MDAMAKFLCAVGALVLTALLLGSVPASAHAVLVGSDPADGARLTVAPRTVSLTFNESIGTHAFIVITAPDGSRLKTESVKVVDATVTARVADSDMKGDYSMAYRVVSIDGHAISAKLTFEVTTGRAVDQVKQDESASFVHRHRSHLLWGALGVAIALGLLVAPLRSHRD